MKKLFFTAILTLAFNTISVANTIANDDEITILLEQTENAPTSGIGAYLEQVKECAKVAEKVVLAAIEAKTPNVVANAENLGWMAFDSCMSL